MKEDRITIHILFISSILLFFMTIIFDNIAISFLLVLIGFPISKYLATKIEARKNN